MEAWGGGALKAERGPRTRNGTDSTYWLCDLGKQLNLSEPRSFSNYCLSQYGLLLRNTRDWVTNTKHVFLTGPEVGTSETMVLADLVAGESPPPELPRPPSHCVLAWQRQRGICSLFLFF